MIIKEFHFNFIQVNTFVLYDETGEAVIVDPGMDGPDEYPLLDEFIKDNNLTIKYVICTHPHIDHILGNGYCVKKYGAPLLMHEAGMKIYDNAVAYGVAFSMQCEKSDFPQPDRFVSDGDVIEFGKQKLEVLYTPGHADGSISLYNRDESVVFVGDLIFQGSVGRSDLPTGNAQILQKSIRTKILPLPDHTAIYPGHGPVTSVGIERVSNPFF